MNFKFGTKSYIPKRFLEIHPPITNTNVRIFTHARVHLHSKNGTYIVKDYDNKFAVITCKKWMNEKERGQRFHDNITILRSDIKCLYNQTG